MPPEELIARTLTSSYDLEPADITRIAAGTVTANFRITDQAGGEWFVKVYRDRSVLHDELAAIELAEFARSDQVPVPGVRRTREGKLIDLGRLPMSVWEYVADAETAESGLTDKRWQTVGAFLGRLHRRLAEHPAAVPTTRPGTGVRDIARSRANFDRLITAYSQRRTLSAFEEWALDAATQRRSLLDQAARILADLPDLTVQIIHGDLASPNLLLRGDDVAAVIDFQPPRPRFLSWETARLACDPRTILLGDQWLTGLPDLLATYRDEHPTAHPNDLLSTPAVACAYTLTSTYPLAEPLNNPSAVTASLESYAKARHQAALILLNYLDEIQTAVRDLR